MKDANWMAYAVKHLLGRRIVGVEYMDEREASDFGWPERVLVLTLDDGTRLIPEADEEGNGPGVLLGLTKSGEQILFPVLP